MRKRLGVVAKLSGRRLEVTEMRGERPTSGSGHTPGAEEGLGTIKTGHLDPEIACFRCYGPVSARTYEQFHPTRRRRSSIWRTRMAWPHFEVLYLRSHPSKRILRCPALPTIRRYHRRRVGGCHYPSEELKAVGRLRGSEAQRHPAPPQHCCTTRDDSTKVPRG